MQGRVFAIRIIQVQLVITGRNEFGGTLAR